MKKKVRKQKTKEKGARGRVAKKEEAEKDV